MLMPKPDRPPLFVLEPRPMESGERFDDYIASLAESCSQSWGTERGHFSGTELRTLRRLGVVAPEPPRELVPNIVGALWLAEGVRAEFGPTFVGNGYRPWALNRRVGGSWRSPHLKFRALDLDLPKADRETQRRLYEWGVRAWLRFGEVLGMGLGLYRPWGGRRIHVDTGRRRRTYWKRRYVAPIVRELR